MAHVLRSVDSIARVQTISQETSGVATAWCFKLCGYSYRDCIVMPKSRRQAQRTSRKAPASASAQPSTRPSTRASTRTSHSFAAARRDPPNTDSIVVNSSRPSTRSGEDSSALPADGPAPPLSEILEWVRTEVRAEMQAIQRGQTPAPPPPIPSNPPSNPPPPRGSFATGMVAS